MKRTGILTVDSGVSRLNGVPFEIKGSPNTFGAATNFLANRNLRHGQLICVDGNDGVENNVAVIHIANASPA